MYIGDALSGDIEEFSLSPVGRPNITPFLTTGVDPLNCLELTS